MHWEPKSCPWTVRAGVVWLLFVVLRAWESLCTLLKNSVNNLWSSVFASCKSCVKGVVEIAEFGSEIAGTLATDVLCSAIWILILWRLQTWPYKVDSEMSSQHSAPPLNEESNCFTSQCPFALYEMTSVILSLGVRTVNVSSYLMEFLNMLML